MSYQCVQGSCSLTASSNSHGTSTSRSEYAPSQNIRVQPANSNYRSYDWAVLAIDSIQNGHFKAFCKRDLEIPSATFLGKAADNIVSAAITKTGQLFNFFSQTMSFMTPIYPESKDASIKRQSKTLFSKFKAAADFEEPEKICGFLQPHLEYFEFLALSLYESDNSIRNVNFQMDLIPKNDFEELKESFHWKIKLIHPVNSILFNHDLNTLHLLPLSVEPIKDAIYRFTQERKGHLTISAELDCPTLNENKNKGNYTKYLENSLKGSNLGLSVMAEWITMSYLDILENAACSSKFEKIRFVVKVEFKNQS
jgi:hypothetical protein